jgi:hypothetical protein
MPRELHHAALLHVHTCEVWADVSVRMTNPPRCHEHPFELNPQHLRAVTITRGYVGQYREGWVTDWRVSARARHGAKVQNGSPHVTYLMAPLAPARQTCARLDAAVILSVREHMPYMLAGECRACKSGAMKTADVRLAFIVSVASVQQQLLELLLAWTHCNRLRTPGAWG